MLALLGMLGGGVMRLLPELLTWLNAKQSNDHEMKMTQLQLDIDKARSAQAIDLVHANAEVAAAATTQQQQGVLQQGDMTNMLEALKGESDRKPSGYPLLDWLSSSVRPILTYWWCIALYTISKACILWQAFDTHQTPAILAALILTEFDTSVVASIISFWFVDRAIRKS